MADSNITKSALASALKELMETTPFAKITVSDICAKCNMNRKSFYYHFRDKFDLVNWIFDVEYLNHVQIGKNLIGWDSVLHLCNYFYENKDFYRKAMKVEDQNSFINHFRELVSPLMAEDIRAAKICRITEILYSGCGAHAGAYEQLKLENIIKYKANSFIKHIGNYRMIYGAVSLCTYVKRLFYWSVTFIHP